MSVAFFFVNSTLERVAAFYPSPAGATESLLPLDAWDEVVDGQPRARRRCSPTSRRSSCAPTRDARRGRVLPRADRRLLRAGRPAAPAVAGLRRRRGGARRRSTTFFADVETGRRAAMSRPRASRCSTPGPSRTRRCRRSCSRTAGHRGRRAARCTRVALRCQIRIEPQRRRYDAPRRRAPRTSCSARRRGGATRCGRSCGRTSATTRRRRSTGATEVDLPDRRAPTTSRWPAPSTSTRSATARSRSSLLFSGTVFTRGDDGLRGRAGRVARRRRPSGCRSRCGAAMMDLYFPEQRLDPRQPRHARRPAAVQGRRGPCPTWDQAFEQLLKEAGEDRPMTRRCVRARPVRRRRARWPTPCSTRATCCTRTGRRRGRTRCAGSSGVLAPPAVQRGRRLRALVDAHRVRCVDPGDATPRAARCASRCLQVQQPRASRRRSHAGRRRTPDVRARRRARGRRGACTSTWDEAVEHEIDLAAARAAARRPSAEPSCAFTLARRRRDRGAARRATATSVGRVVRRARAGRTRRCASRRSAPTGRQRCLSSRWRSTVENTTAWDDDDAAPRATTPWRRVAGRRAHAAGRRRRRRSSRCSTRPTTPPTPVAGCRSDGTFPVLDRRRRRRRALVADHPLRPPRGGARERGRPVRRHRDRRDPRPAGPDAHRRGEGRGPGHRPPRRRHHRSLRRHVARDAGRGCTATDPSTGCRPARRRAGRATDRRRRRRCRGGTRPSTRRSIRGPTPCRSAASRSAQGTPVRLRPSAARRRARHVPRRRWPPRWRGSSTTSTASVHVAVTLDDDPGGGRARVAGPLPLLPSRRGRARRGRPTRAEAPA